MKNKFRPHQAIPSQISKLDAISLSLLCSATDQSQTQQRTHHVDYFVTSRNSVTSSTLKQSVCTEKEHVASFLPQSRTLQFPNDSPEHLLHIATRVLHGCWVGGFSAKQAKSCQQFATPREITYRAINTLTWDRKMHFLFHFLLICHPSRLTVSSKVIFLLRVPARVNPTEQSCRKLFPYFS